jgi:S1-C subfamily serine protease
MKYGIHFARVTVWALLPLSLCGQQKRESPSAYTVGPSILQDTISRSIRSPNARCDPLFKSMSPVTACRSAARATTRRTFSASAPWAVIVDQDGYIVTNNHVVSGAVRIRVTLSPATVELVTGRTVVSHKEHVYDATLIGTNRYPDLAVIKIEEKNLPFIPLPEDYG